MRAKGYHGSFLQGEALFTRKCPHEVTYMLSLSPSQALWVLPDGSARLMVRTVSGAGSGVVTCVLGLRGGLTFECKTDCALASPCPMPLGRLVVSGRIDACSRLRCLFGLLFSLGCSCLLLCKLRGKASVPGDLCRGLSTVYTNSLFKLQVESDWQTLAAARGTI